MGNPEAVIVSAFKGIHRPGLTGRITERRVLDEPKEMYNFHLTEDGHLYMPQAADVLHDFSADGEIQTLHWAEDPQGIVVQMSNGKIYHIGIEAGTGQYDPDPLSPSLLATIPSGEEQWNIWVNAVRDGYFLMGYCPRGSAGPATDGKMWKVSGTHTSPTVTDLTGTVGRASWSTLYKGRRFWVTRGRTVSYSPLNQPDQPSGVDDNFQISGDDGGNTYWDNPGYVQGMIAWEDVLVFFLTGSVWILTGSSPDTFNLRQVQTMVGNQSAWSLVRTDDGVLTFGGRNLNDPGIYLFTGSNAVKMSPQIDDWMKSLGSTTQVQATISSGKYIFATSRSGADNRQFLIFDLRTRQWTAFDGFENGTACVRGTTMLVSKDGVLYSSNNEIFPRLTGRGASITLGYQDDENPTGLVRYLGLKISGRKWGTGTPTITATVNTPDGQVVSGPHNIPTDVFDSLVIPLNIRGAGIELDLEFTPADDDNELLIENIQVIASRKSEKVSRD